MPIELIITWMMVFLRGLGVVMMIPTLASRPLPPVLRAAISAMLASILYGLVPHASHGSLEMWSLIRAAGGEVVLGLVFGFMGRLLFSAVDMAGRMITQEIGLSAAPGIDAPTPATEPLAAFLSTFAGVMFFMLGGHLGALSAFARSFELAPAGAPAFSQLSIEYLVRGTAHVIELGFRIAAPFIAMNFLINLAFSVLGRAVPRMNVFIMSYSLRVLVGFGLLAGSGALLVRYLVPEFNNLPYQMLEMVGR